MSLKATAGKEKISLARLRPQIAGSWSMLQGVLARQAHMLLQQ
jgi:hypothetical protein